jgi:hypothetical protein
LSFSGEPAAAIFARAHAGARAGEDEALFRTGAPRTAHLDRRELRRLRLGRRGLRGRVLRPRALSLRGAASATSQSRRWRASRSQSPSSLHRASQCVRSRAVSWRPTGRRRAGSCLATSGDCPSDPSSSSCAASSRVQSLRRTPERRSRTR